MHGRAERTEDAHPPVADLVAEPFDDHGAIVGHDARGLGLFTEVEDHVVRCEGIEVVLAHEALHRILLGEGADLALEGAEGPSELQRPTGAVAVPERHLARLPRRRGDDDALEGDVLDAPRGRAEDEGLPGTGLVHHLLVELADARAVRQEDAEQTTVGDGATAGDGEALGAIASTDRVVDAVPHQPGPQLVELLAGIAPGEQI